MGVLEKIEAFFRRTFFRRGKVATEAEPKLADEKKTTETGGQAGATKE